MNSNSENGTILVVDDTLANLGLLFDLFDKSSFKVLVAQDGESAIQKAEYAKPDIILLDIMMPGIDGFETCLRLKNNSSTEDIPIIFMTALSEVVDKVRGFEIGAVDYVTKPFQPEEVLARVKTHLTLRSLQNNLQIKNEELANINAHLEELVVEKTHQLIQQEKSAIIGRLIKGMVHNLKNPINAIASLNLMIHENLQQIFDPQIHAIYAKQIDELLEDSLMISHAVKQVVQIIDNLMLRSRLEQTNEFSLISVNNVIHQEVQFMNANIQFKNKVMKVVLLDESLPTLPLIYSNLAQIFQNLICNALDAMWELEEQKLTITTSQDETQVYIKFQDTGCGISPDKIEKIFDPFYTSKPIKGEEQQEGQPTGTGLGLYTCVELLKPFNGRLIVSSEVAKGSIFTVVLPKQIGNTLEK